MAASHGRSCSRRRNARIIGFSAFVAVTSVSPSTSTEKFRQFGGCLPGFAGRPGTGELRAMTHTHASQMYSECDARTRFCPTKLAPIQSPTRIPRVVSPAQCQHAVHASSAQPATCGAPQRWWTWVEPDVIAPHGAGTARTARRGSCRSTSRAGDGQSRNRSRLAAPRTASA